MNNTNQVIEQKILDLNIPGVAVSFDPDEAEILGAFEETALDEQTAWASTADLLTGDLFVEQ